MNVKHTDIDLFYEYTGNFDAFARIFFDVETTHDLATQIVNYVGHEDVIVAHIVWSAIFNHDRTYLVACPTVALVHHWRNLVTDALVKLPGFMIPDIRGRRDELDIANGCKILFRVCNENTCRGMTINGLYIIEPPLIKRYYEFMQSVMPTMASGKNRQTFNYSRGY